MRIKQCAYDYSYCFSLFASGYCKGNETFICQIYLHEIRIVGNLFSFLIDFEWHICFSLSPQPARATKFFLLHFICLLLHRPWCFELFALFAKRIFFLLNKVSILFSMVVIFRDLRWMCSIVILELCLFISVSEWLHCDFKPPWCFCEYMNDVCVCVCFACLLALMVAIECPNPTGLRYFCLHNFCFPFLYYSDHFCGKC